MKIQMDVHGAGRRARVDSSSLPIGPVAAMRASLGLQVCTLATTHQVAGGTES